MNEDMPWVNLTQEEVEDLRKSKKELTEYGKQQLRKLMNNEPLHATVSEEDYQKVLDLMNNQEPYPDAMFEEAERREAERKALDAVDKLYKENGDAMKQAKLEGVFKIPDDPYSKINLSKHSNWKCYMFGNRPDVNCGIMYIPAEGHVPNRFVRFMMRICFDCLWVENK